MAQVLETVAATIAAVAVWHLMQFPGGCIYGNLRFWA